MAPTRTKRRSEANTVPGPLKGFRLQYYQPAKQSPLVSLTLPVQGEQAERAGVGGSGRRGPIDTFPSHAEERKRGRRLERTDEGGSGHA